MQENNSLETSAVFLLFNGNFGQFLLCKINDTKSEYIYMS